MEGSREGPRERTSSAAGPKTRAVPAAALKRFADDLDRAKKEEGHKFLDINLKRVADFIEKTNEEIYGEGAIRVKEPERRRQSPGVYTYLPPAEPKTLLKLQHEIEATRGLGCRSRFGDGDGSFFDRWLNGDVISSKRAHDKNGLPAVAGVELEPQTGFKRHLFAFKANVDTTQKRHNCSTIRPYKERREERLKKEAELQQADSSEKAGAGSPAGEVRGHVRTSSRSPGVGLLSDDGEWQNHFASSPPPINSRPGTRLDSALPSVTSPADAARRAPTSVSRSRPLSTSLEPTLDPAGISAVEKETYFGPNARAAFFDFYRQLSRQRYTFSREASRGAASPSLVATTAPHSPHGKRTDGAGNSSRRATSRQRSGASPITASTAGGNTDARENECL